MGETHCLECNQPLLEFEVDYCEECESEGFVDPADTTDKEADDTDPDD